MANALTFGPGQGKLHGTDLSVTVQASYNSPCQTEGQGGQLMAHPSKRRIPETGRCLAGLSTPSTHVIGTDALGKRTVLGLVS